MSAKARKEEVVKQYTDGGWNVHSPGGINDYVAYRGGQSHFVRVVVDSLETDPKCTGIQKNEFVQNAMSNGATPIFAVCTVSKKKGEEAVIKAKFVNANTMGASVIKKRAPPAKKTTSTKQKKPAKEEPEKKDEST